MNGNGNGNGNGALLQSRKFVAYLIAELTWKILAGLVLFWGKDTMPNQVFIIMLGIVLVAGFVETIYIGNQAALDKFTRVADIIVSGTHGHGVEMKGMLIKAVPPKEPDPAVVEPKKEEEPPETAG